MTKIIGISGKKQSGKTSIGNFLFGCAMVSNEVVEYATIDDYGSLVVPYEEEDGTLKPCVFPVDSIHPEMIKYMEENVWNKVKIYSFADSLKRLRVNVLGLTERQCYGTEKDKSSLTQFNWSDMIFYEEKRTSCPMTAREVMQYVGTDFFRKIYPEVWVDSTIRQIEKDKPELAVIVDCRFPNEANGIKNAGGKVIRLTRNIFGEQDQHRSETALDNYDNFDATIDNHEMSIKEQNETVYNQLIDWKVVDFKAVAGSSNS